MKTRAVRQGDGYVLNGTKLWITNGSIADVAVVWAREDDGEISGFLVEKGTPGYSTLDIHGKFSMRASITSELSFQDCRIPARTSSRACAACAVRSGCLNQARYGIAWGAVGAAMAVYDWALQYAQQRIQFGKPIAASSSCSEAGVDGHGDHQGPAPVLAARPAQGSGPGATPAGLPGQDEQRSDGPRRRPAGPGHHGGGGHRGRAPRHPAYAQPRDGNTYEGTHDIHTLIVGRDIAGLDAFGMA